MDPLSSEAFLRAMNQWGIPLPPARPRPMPPISPYVSPTNKAEAGLPTPLMTETPVSAPAALEEAVVNRRRACSAPLPLPHPDNDTTRHPRCLREVHGDAWHACARSTAGCPRRSRFHAPCPADEYAGHDGSAAEGTAAEGASGARTSLPRLGPDGKLLDGARRRKGII